MLAACVGAACGKADGKAARRTGVSKNELVRFEEGPMRFPYSPDSITRAFYLG